MKHLQLALNIGALSLVSAGLAPLASAEEEPLDLSVGVGVGIESQIYRGADSTNTYPVPLINYQRPNFYFQGTELGVFLQPNETLKVALIADFEFPAYEEDDSIFLTGMGDREFTVNAGGRVTLSFKPGNSDYGSVSFKAVTEVTDEHEGSEVTIDYSRSFPVLNNNAILTPGVGVEFISSDKAEYNYGVSPFEALANPFVAAPYDPGSVTNYKIGVNVVYILQPKHSIFGSVTAKFLDDDIDDSPIVDDDLYTAFILGYSYKF